ncbi:MAG: phage terminase large subunit [Patescibacteria group bacterium]|nr:phage terminase large subunit [Patescibacteria group bacterium]
MPTPAQQEFLRRLELRGSFVAWCQQAGYEPAKHHLLIIRELEGLVERLFAALIRGNENADDYLRLMVLCPPGSAKSTYISKLFPPWFLAQATRLETMMLKANHRYEPLGILACTHNKALEVEFGGAARNLVATNERWLGYTLTRDSRASDAWTCTNRCYYRAGTVGSGISGRRMHLGIVDDFCGQEADATSKIENEKVWQWWLNDFINRLQPIAARVIIANHRNEDDLIGRLLSKEASKWRIVRLRLLIESEEQAEQDPLGRHVGEWLWPEYFTEAQVKERMENPRASGIQQQEPSPEKGSFFESEWIDANTYKSNNDFAGGSFYGASDHAVGTSQQNDPSCFGIGIWKNNILYIHPDLEWDRLGPKQAVEAMLRLGSVYQVINWWAEKGHISKSIGPFLQDRMIAEGKYFSVTQVTPTKDKMTRAQCVKGMFQSGRVRLPAHAKWFSRARHELLVFPNGRHDDFVDFIAHLGRGVNRMYNPTENKKDEVKDVLPPVMGMNMTMRDVKAQLKHEQIKQRQLAYY